MSTPDERHGMALWYAWGMADSGRIPALTLDHGFKFADQQRTAQQDYNAERTYMMESIMSAFRKFLMAEGLTFPVCLTAGGVTLAPHSELVPR